jgi:hypothetical protein
MHKTTTIISYECDFCRKKMSCSVSSRRITLSKGPKGPEGIEIYAKGFGYTQEQNDICKECFDKAILKLAKEIKDYNQEDF